MFIADVSDCMPICLLFWRPLNSENYHFDNHPYTCQKLIDVFFQDVLGLFTRDCRPEKLHTISLNPYVESRQPLVVHPMNFNVKSLQLVHVDVNADLSSRLKGYFWDVWNLFDCLCLLLFILAIILRSIKVVCYIYINILILILLTGIELVMYRYS